MKKNVDYYMSLPYTRLIQSRTDDGKSIYYYGTIDELDGCQATGDTLQELDEMLTKSMRMHLETMIELGWDIPEPRRFSGKVLFRMPETVHRRLYYEAKAQGVSLNQYGVSKLAK